MANMLFDIVPPALLTQYSRAYDNEVLRPQAQFVLGTWMPDLYLEDLDYRIRKDSLQDVDMAEYRAWDTPGKLTGRPGVSRISGELGPITRGIMLGEEERLRERALMAGNNDPIVTQIYADAERMTRSVRARIEMAIGDVIDDGKVTIVENGLVLEADFGRDGTWASQTSPTTWTNVAATILGDLLGWQEVYFNKMGLMPVNLFIPRARLANMALNTEMRNYAASNGTIPTRINKATIDAIFAAEGLPNIVVYDGVFRKDGTQVHPLNPNKVYFMPNPGELGNAFWGITAEALVLREKGMIEREEAPGLVVFNLFQDHPVQTTTMATAVCLPVMPNPNLVNDFLVVH